MFSACPLYIFTSYSLPPTAIWYTLFTLGNLSSEACGHLCPYRRSLPLLPCMRSLGPVGSPLGLHVLWPPCRSSCRLLILSLGALSVPVPEDLDLSSPNTASVFSLVLIPSQHMSAQPVLWDLSAFKPVPTKSLPGDHRQPVHCHCTLNFSSPSEQVGQLESLLSLCQVTLCMD